MIYLNKHSDCIYVLWSFWLHLKFFYTFYKQWIVQVHKINTFVEAVIRIFGLSTSTGSKTHVMKRMLVWKNTVVGRWHWMDYKNIIIIRSSTNYNKIIQKLHENVKHNKSLLFHYIYFRFNLKLSLHSIILLFNIYYNFMIQLYEHINFISGGVLRTDKK
jgi:hypothetical protein